MKILCDIAGLDVSYAMYLLFEKRLGHELWFMKGMDWWKYGYWNLTTNTNIAGQVLEATSTGYMKKHGWPYRTLTHDQLMQPDQYGTFDILLCVNNNERGFAKLVADHLNNAKIIRHIGNLWERIAKDSAPNIIFSITPNDQNTDYTIKNLDNKNWVYAHQEFDTEKEFVFVEPYNFNRISAYQTHDLMDHEEYGQLFLKYAKLLPEFEFHRYGPHGEYCYNIGKELGQSFQKTSFVWETKGGEDGGSHIFYNAFATGRPLIIKSSLCDGIALKMLKDGINCLDIDKNSTEGLVEEIRHYSRPENLKKMSQEVYKTFQEYCNYEKEAEDVRKFMETLK